MSTPKDLNNSVVIPARNVREYSANSLAKNNNIELFSYSNNDYLVKHPIDKSYVFANVSNVSGTGTAIWENILSNENVLFESTKATDVQEKTILSNSLTQGGKTIRINASINYYALRNYEHSKTKSLVNVVLRDGETISYWEQWNDSSSVYGRWDFSIKYSGGTLTLTASHSLFTSLTKWSIDFSISSIDLMLEDGYSNDIVINNNTYVFNATTLFSLTDDSEIFLVPTEGEIVSSGTTTNKKWYEIISADVSYQKTTTNSNSPVQVNNEKAYVFTYTFDRFEDFRSACSNVVNGSSILYIGIPTKSIKKIKDESVLRFDNTFNLYLCSMVIKSDTEFYDNISVDIQTLLGTSYRKQTQLVEYGTKDNNSNVFNYNGNSLFQEETMFVVDNKEEGVVNNILDDIAFRFKNGRNTTNVSIFYDKYLDLSGSPVYNGVDGYFPKTDDIVTPYTIRSRKNMKGFVEVPLYTDNYDVDENGNQVAVGKQFYVTSCSFEYNGDFRIDLECIEKTD